MAIQKIKDRGKEVGGSTSGASSLPSSIILDVRYAISRLEKQVDVINSSLSSVLTSAEQSLFDIQAIYDEVESSYAAFQASIAAFDDDLASIAIDIAQIQEDLSSFDLANYTRKDLNEIIYGDWEFDLPLVLGTPGTTVSHAVRADRSILTGNSLVGGGNLTANRTLNTVQDIRTTDSPRFQRLGLGKSQNASFSIAAISTIATDGSFLSFGNSLSLARTTGTSNFSGGVYFQNATASAIEGGLQSFSSGGNAINQMSLAFGATPVSGSTTGIHLRNDLGSEFRIGVGTSSPAEKLDVKGNILTNANFIANGGGIRLNRPSAGAGYARGMSFVSTDGTTVEGGVEYLGSTTNPPYQISMGFGATVYNSALALHMRNDLGSEFRIGIGHTNPTKTLDVNGEILGRDKITGNDTITALDNFIAYKQVEFWRNASEAGTWARGFLAKNPTGATIEAGMVFYGNLDNSPTRISLGLGATPWSTVNGITLRNDLGGEFRVGIGVIDPEQELDVGGESLFKGAMFTRAPALQIGSESFSSGFGGHGYRVNKTGTKYDIEADELTIRGTFNVYEILAREISAVNGNLFISAENEIESIESSANEVLNLVTYSEQLNHANWIKNLVTVVVNNAVAPDGTTTAEKLTLSSEALGCYQAVTGTYLAGDRFTVSAWVWADAPTTINTGIITNVGSTDFNGVLHDIGTTPKRISYTATLVANATVIYPLPAFTKTAPGLAGTGARTVYVWGVQMYEGDGPLHYVKSVETPGEDLVHTIITKGKAKVTKGSYVIGQILADDFSSSTQFRGHVIKQDYEIVESEYVGRLRIQDIDGTPEIGMALARYDHSYKLNERGYVYIATSDSGSPFQAVRYGDGLGTWPMPAGSELVRMGRLNGLSALSAETGINAFGLATGAIDGSSGWASFTGDGIKFYQGVNQVGYVSDSGIYIGKNSDHLSFNADTSTLDIKIGDRNVITGDGTSIHIGASNTPLRLSGSSIHVDGSTTFSSGMSPADIQAAAALYIQSRGSNLITNGTGLLGDNTNFPGWTFDIGRSTAGRGSFRATDGPATKFLSEIIPVSRGDTYRFSFDAGCEPNTNNRQYSGLAFYDIDEVQIWPYHWQRYGDVATLTAPLNTNDTVINVDSTSGWYNGADAPSRKLRFSGFSSVGGIQYGDDYSQLLYTSASGMWASGALTTTTIPLTAPWAGPSYAIGDRVSSAKGGGSYAYFPMENQSPSLWTSYSGSIGPSSTYGDFPPGTAFVRPIFLTNYSGTASPHVGTALNVGNLYFGPDISSANSLGDLAYYDAVLQAMQDETIIVGGFISTNLVDAHAIFADTIKVGDTTAALWLNPGGLIESDNTTPGDLALAIGTGNVAGSAQFRVKYDGSLVATNADISGTLRASSNPGTLTSTSGIGLYASGNLFNLQQSGTSFIRGDGSSLQIKIADRNVITGTSSGIYIGDSGTRLTLSGDSIQIDGGTTFSAGMSPDEIEAAAYLAARNYVQSRPENLMTNGTGFFGDNTNFSQFVFDPTRFTTGRGSFRATAPGGAISDERIPVDTAKTYKLSADLLADPYTGNTAYAGVAPYDIDGDLILPQYYMINAGSSVTTLSHDLNEDDNTIRLVDATGWYAGTTSHQRSIRMSGYSPPSGTTYGDEYSRLHYEDKWASGAISGNTITLSAPWSGPDYPAGTRVSNSMRGGVYPYLVAANRIVPSLWENFSGTIGGIHNTPGAPATNKFPPATSSVSFYWAPLYQGVAGIHAGGAMNVGNIRFEEDRLIISDLGLLASYDSILAAMQDQTVITGGYIETTLIDAEAIFADQITVGSTSGALWLNPNWDSETNPNPDANDLALSIGTGNVATNAQFRVKYNGSLVATNADISGTLKSGTATATSGSGLYSSSTAFNLQTGTSYVRSDGTNFNIRVSGRNVVTGSGSDIFLGDAGTKLTLSGSSINITGATTFSSGFSPTDIRTAAVNEMAASLGDLASLDLISAALLDTTVIVGGVILTSLISVQRLFAQSITVGTTGTAALYLNPESDGEDYDPGPNDVALSIGSNAGGWDSQPFEVQYDGSFKATNATIDGLLTAGTVKVGQLSPTNRGLFINANNGWTVDNSGFAQAMIGGASGIGYSSLFGDAITLGSNVSITGDLDVTGSLDISGAIFIGTGGSDTGAFYTGNATMSSGVGAYFGHDGWALRSSTTSYMKDSGSGLEAQLEELSIDAGSFHMDSNGSSIIIENEGETADAITISPNPTLTPPTDTIHVNATSTVNYDNYNTSNEIYDGGTATIASGTTGEGRALSVGMELRLVSSTSNFYNQASFLVKLTFRSKVLIGGFYQYVYKNLIFTTDSSSFVEIVRETEWPAGYDFITMAYSGYEPYPATAEPSSAATYKTKFEAEYKNVLVKSADPKTYLTQNGLVVYMGNGKKINLGSGAVFETDLEVTGTVSIAGSLFEVVGERLFWTSPSGERTKLAG